MEKAVGYVRVSTSKQADDGYGLTSQKQDIRAWAKKNGFRLTGIFEDRGLSGTIEAEDRPGLAEALLAVADGEAVALVVGKIDRLARQLTTQEAALAQVWDHGGRVFTADAGEVLRDDPDEPMRTAMRQMRGVFAQLDRAMIVARLQTGRRVKAEQGGYAYGAPRYGTKAVDRELVVDDSEANAVALIRQLRHDGASYRTICASLTAAGFRPRRSDTWHPTVVARIVSRS